MSICLCMENKLMNKKIKILFDASVLNNIFNNNSSRSGIFWTAFNLLKSLSQIQNVNLYLYSDNFDKTKRFINYVKDDIFNIKPFDGDIKEMDVVFSPYKKIHNSIRNSGIPCYTLLHDCIPLILPQYFGEYTKGWFCELFNSLNSQDYYFSNSEYTKKDFLRLCSQLNEKQIITIPLATNLSYKPNKNLTDEIREKYNIPTDKKYLFSLCSLEPRKNLIRVVRTFIQFIEKNKIDDLVFVLGGGAWGGFIEKLEKEVSDYQKYKDKIIRAGYVADEDLEVLYSNAEWFVYTSQYEGFGMPPLEAMSCGTAVITSNNSSLPEVVGDAGQTIDWDSDEQHIEAYEKYYFDKSYRDTMAKKGLCRSKLFSWDDATKIMVEQFKKMHINKKRKSFILANLFNTHKKQVLSIYIFGIPLLKINQNIK